MIITTVSRECYLVQKASQIVEFQLVWHIPRCYTYLLVVVFPYMLNSVVFNFAGKSQILRLIYHKLDLVVVRHIHGLRHIESLPAVVSDSLRASCTSKVTVLIRVYNCGRSGGSARRRLVWVITGLLFQPDRNLRCPLNVPPCRPWFYIDICIHSPFSNQIIGHVHRARIR